jgi:HEAT repeat protein
MRRLLLACLLLLPAGCAAEAEFQGHTTSYWIGQLKSPNYMDRVRAANALSHLGRDARRATPDLIVLLDDPQPLVRWAAADTLGGFGADARDALPALKELAAKEPYPPTRSAAEEAVRRISSAAEKIGTD